MRADTASEPSLLIATDLTRAYRGGKGVFDIRLRLAAGEVVGVMGPNGSGKTTLLRLLATAATPTSGQVSWFGTTNARDPSVRRRLGVMLDQAAHFDQMTGYQNAWFFAHQFGLSDALARERLDELFSWSGLWDARDQLVGEYSLGMKRRLNLVEALVHRPSILLLDEPTLALDYRAELDLIERLQLLSLTGTAGFQSLHAANLISPASEFWTAGPTVTWRLLEYPRLRANIRSQSAQQEQVLAQY